MTHLSFLSTQKAGTALPSCTQMLLEEFEDDDFGSAKEENLKWTTSQLFAGGSDTVGNSLCMVGLDRDK
jgi:hypothetical protein